MSEPDRAGHLLAEALLRATVGAFAKAMWRPVLVNPEALPARGPCFFYGNHSNMLDAFVLNAFTRFGQCTAGVMTRERFRGGLATWAFRRIGLLPTQKRLAEPPLIRGVYRLLEAGRAVVIYPEGGQRWTGRPMPWIEATAKLFVRCGVPVYPVRTHGSYLGWPRWADHPRPARLFVEILPPLTFDRATPLDEALARLRAPIAAHDDAVFPPESRPRRAYRPAAGLHRLLYRDPDTGTYGGLSSPDGTHVVNRAGTLRLRMLSDSTLVDERTGARHTTGDLYERIRALPLEKDRDGALLRDRVALHTERAYPHLVPHGTVTATLYDDALRLEGPDVRRTVPLEALRYADIERNYKLQLTFSDEMLQLGFTGAGSALAWLDALARLRPDVTATVTERAAA
ncbi:1-acyl-sn-glycerol-3-phosphate acyltransferase [Rhodocaloribacter litoris]|uniref:lysophospholipid acyltransferase family protein n=1 Tax=Rhodocaloribacter litoris TaxID=2558931 RepID=UPI001E30F3DE|nr:lysophospholipid acyltransferase family protein [Rhodocaloribacter litoris]QXD14982.1 1-acyl-sn-glycerol-3-phosphate acyltransferase [Rhodocaloribacter litoris]